MPPTFTSEGLPPPPNTTSPVFTTYCALHTIYRLSLSLARSPAPLTADALSSFSAGCNEPKEAVCGRGLHQTTTGGSHKAPRTDRWVVGWVGCGVGGVGGVDLGWVGWVGVTPVWDILGKPRQRTELITGAAPLSVSQQGPISLLALTCRVLLEFNSCLATVLCQRQGREVWGLAADSGGGRRWFGVACHAAVHLQCIRGVILLKWRQLVKCQAPFAPSWRPADRRPRSLSKDKCRWNSIKSGA